MDIKLENFEGMLNFIFGVIGLIIIWTATHSYWGLIGGVIAGIHFNLNKSKS